MSAPPRPGPISTDRLVLRQWRATDRAPFATMNADPDVMEFYPSPLSQAESDAFVERASAHLEREGWGLWAVDVADSGTFIGYVGLAVPHFDPSLTEVGWRLTRSAWGHGYASEAARAALDVAFDRLGLAQVVSFTSATNARSRRVMERLGMRRDPDDDFDHPGVPEGSPLRRHVLYRLAAPQADPDGTAHPA